MLVHWLAWSLALVTLGLLWVPTRSGVLPLWGAGLLVLIALALAIDLIAPLALMWLGFALLGGWLWASQPSGRAWLWLPLTLYMLALGMGVLPGFARVELLAPEFLGRSEQAYGASLSLAKPLLGLLLIAVVLREPQRHLQLFGALRAWPLWLVPALVVFAAAWLLGVALDVKWPWWTPLFILGNCCLTVIPEEAFFRGLLQQPLQRLLGVKLGVTQGALASGIVIILMGTVFAAVHLGAWAEQGVRLPLLMFVAGCAYAWCYARSRRLEAVILAHVTVNSLHFVLLTYPLAFA